MTSLDSPELSLFHILSPQHRDSHHSLTILSQLSQDKAAILAIVSAANNDPSLLKRFKEWYEQLPESGDDYVAQLKAQLPTQKRRSKNDGFYTGKILNILYCKQQRIVLRDIIDRCEAIQAYKLTLLTMQSSSTSQQVSNLTNSIPSPPPPPAFRLYVGGLGQDILESEIESGFKNFLGIKNIFLPPNKTNPHLKAGYCFIEFTNYLSFAGALQGPVFIRGRAVNVQMPKDSEIPVNNWLKDRKEYEERYGVPTILTEVSNNNLQNMSHNNPQAIPPQTPTIPSTSLQDIPTNSLPASNINGNILCIANMFTEEDKGEIPLEELKDEITIQCDKFGTILDILVRFDKEITAKNIAGVENKYYPVFVTYNNSVSVQDAIKGIGGLTFDGRRLYAYATDRTGA
jgi:hypothetical protein